MKEFIKSITFYNVLYPLFRRTVFYHYFKKAYSQIAVLMNGNPSQEFIVVGVTGTDGKTTVSNLLHKITNDNLGKTMVISTATIKIGDQEQKNTTKMTSLDIFSLQSYLSIGKDQQCKYAILEVASHGLDQYRFEGVEFDGAILTNITPEHLDYHGTMENYVNTKKKLFNYVSQNKKQNKFAILPRDDEYGRRREQELFFEKTITFGIKNSGVLRAIDISVFIDHTTFTIEYLGKQYPVKTSMIGEYNVYNILAAIGGGIALGCEIEKCIVSIEGFNGVAGRMEPVEIKGVQYFVDFAHTPNGLQSTISFLRAIEKKGRIITVFGATGERDAYKRPLMGKVVDELSDIIIVTDDDPGGEHRVEIVSQIVAGIQREEGDNFFILPEREFALKMAVHIAVPGDIVLLAGKGHEEVQITNFGKRKWSDKDKIIEFASQEKQG